MSFFKRLFGIKDQAGASAQWEPHAEVTEHEGFAIIPKPVKEGGQYRLAGTISKEVNGEVKEHTLIRADLFSSAEECAEFTVKKAKQVIQEQGEGMFT